MSGGEGPGLHNFRPLGGMAVPAGGRIRDDLLFRSAAPLRDPARAGRGVAARGIGTVVDLRDGRERAQTPGAWDDSGLRVRPVPVFGDTLHVLRFERLDELYTIMVDSCGPRLARAYDEVEEHAAHGVLIHCTAGKDRTGLLSALVLESLGAARDDVLADFALSQRLLGPEYLADLFAGTDPQSLPGMAAHRATSSPPDLLADALGRIDARYGDSVGFLRAHGVSEERIARLRAVMLR